MDSKRTRTAIGTQLEKGKRGIMEHGSAGVALGNTARAKNVQGAIGCAAYAAYLAGSEVGVWGPDALGYIVSRMDSPVTRDDIEVVYVARP